MSTDNAIKGYLLKMTLSVQDIECLLSIRQAINMSELISMVP